MLDAMRYRYLGPPELQGLPPSPAAVEVSSVETLRAWLARRPPAELVEPFTFVVAVDGWLWLAPRRSEHVACAGGRDVLAAGEALFAPDAAGWRVEEISNQSTGYCPDPSCWPAVAAAFDQIGVPHPGGFTHPIVFRVCPSCAAINVVRDGDFACAVCGDDLPERP